MLRRLLLAALALAGLVVIAVVAGLLWLRGEIRESLPRLEGEVAVRGIGAPVRIARDGLGVPTIRGRTREDVAFGTGFVHGQDRFFQMDLMRRRAAGELAELVGAGIVRADVETRAHRFRALAREVVARSEAGERGVLVAYTAGVNAGLRSLGGPPPEYRLLQVDPAPWRAEDIVLVLLGMFLELQDEDGGRERAMDTMRASLPQELVAFLEPAGTEWDAPLSGDPLLPPPIPGREVFDVRGGNVPLPRPGDPGPDRAPERRSEAGSNNWVVSGAHTADGAPLLANDMHLGLRVPNTWYRLVLRWPDGAGRLRRTVGVSLPGTPAVVVGSNGDVAWGFTSSYIDSTDLVLLDRDAPTTFHRERVEVKGERPRTIAVPWTRWGPVVAPLASGAGVALRWTAHDPEAVDLRLLRMERVRTAHEALELATRCGIPAQNIVVADRAGHIGWTICGRIPRRVGLDGSTPRSWADGAAGWKGWLAGAEVPRVVDPPGGRIWTANARVVGGADLALLGNSGYGNGARARQIRDDLLAIERATARDMLHVQLDDRAPFFARWQRLLLQVLSSTDSDEFRAARPHVERWGARASVSSVGFRIVRAFRTRVSELVFPPLTAACQRLDPTFRYSASQLEGPLWRLVTARPIHLLEPRFGSWDDLLRMAAEDTLRTLAEDGRPLAEQTWGRRNTVHVRHPLSFAVPRLTRWLDMAPVELPGAEHMPRIQLLEEGASERLVVSPGREEQGILHMPGGQSGHPWSPHYADGHDAWARGLPTPLLPGKAVSVLTLVPARTR